jgi:hypothetical protein
MTKDDVHNDEIRLKERGREPVLVSRWGDPGGIQTIRSLRFRTSQIQKPSSAFGQVFWIWLYWILTPPSTLLRPAGPGLRPAGTPLSAHARV